MNLVLCILIGFLSGMCGVFFKIGAIGKSTAIQASSYASLAGAVMFAILGRHEWSCCSWQVVFAGFIFGTTQYLVNLLLRLALKHGPLSPIWCAFSLNFVPVIIYCSLFLNEHLSTCQHIAIYCTVCSIIAASFGAKDKNKKEKISSAWLYGLILVCTLLSASVINTGLKFCSVHCIANHPAPMATEAGKLLMLFTYLFLGLESAIDNTFNKGWIFNKYAAISILGVSATAPLAYCITVAIVAKVPAVTLFALSYAMSLTTASIASVIFFKEKKSLSWILTITFGLLAILLNR